MLLVSLTGGAVEAELAGAPSSRPTEPSRPAPPSRADASVRCRRTAGRLAEDVDPSENDDNSP